MPVIPRSTLSIPPRQRKEIPRATLLELKESIRDNTLLHAPVVQQSGPDTYILVAGERRTRAIDLLAEEGLPFIYNQNSVLPGYIPVVLLDEALNDIQKAEIELA